MTDDQRKREAKLLDLAELDGAAVMHQAGTSREEARKRAGLSREAMNEDYLKALHRVRYAVKVLERAGLEVLLEAPDGVTPPAEETPSEAIPQTMAFKLAADLQARQATLARLRIIMEGRDRILADLLEAISFYAEGARWSTMAGPGALDEFKVGPGPETARKALEVAHQRLRS